MLNDKLILMKNFKYIKIICFFLLAILSVWLLQACCSQEYIFGDIFRNVKFYDATTGKNLFFGTDKIFNKDSVYIKYQNDSNFYKLTYSEQDSLFSLNFKESTVCYLLFQNGNVDTLSISYMDNKVKHAIGTCYQNVKDISGILYNNQTINSTQVPLILHVKN